MLSSSEELVRLGDLLERGLITRAEFEVLKAEVLASSASDFAPVAPSRPPATPREARRAANDARTASAFAYDLVIRPLGANAEAHAATFACKAYEAHQVAAQAHAEAFGTRKGAYSFDGYAANDAEFYKRNLATRQA